MKNIKTAIIKTDRYDWAKPGDTGRQMKIPIGELKIDHGYQRSEVSDINTLAIARDFNWIACGALIVMERNNGDRYIVDGYQRYLAMKRRQDIEAVPCIVYHSDGRDHEARAFLQLNTRRKHVRAVDKYRAAVKAGIKPESDIARWLDLQGLRVDNNSEHGASIIDFPTNLLTTWKKNESCAKRAILVQQYITDSVRMAGNIHRGLTWLAMNGVDIESHADKIRARGGRTELQRAIREYCIESGQNAGENICGRAILRVINHKMKRKITITPSE